MVPSIQEVFVISFVIGDNKSQVSHVLYSAILPTKFAAYTLPVASYHIISFAKPITPNNHSVVIHNLFIVKASLELLVSEPSVRKRRRLKTRARRPPRSLSLSSQHPISQYMPSSKRLAYRKPQHRRINARNYKAIASTTRPCPRVSTIIWGKTAHIHRSVGFCFLNHQSMSANSSPYRKTYIYIHM